MQLSVHLVQKEQVCKDSGSERLELPSDKVKGEGSGKV